MLLREPWASKRPPGRTVHDTPLDAFLIALRATYSDVAKRVGTTHSTILRLARGARPSEHMAYALLAVLRDMVRERCVGAVEVDSATLFPSGVDPRRAPHSLPRNLKLRRPA